MYDWNGNGKYDPQDGFIDYQIYNSSKQSGVNNSDNSDNSGGCLFWICFLLVLIVFPPIGILMILYAMFTK